MNTEIPEAPETDFSLKQIAGNIERYVGLLKSLGFFATAVHSYVIPDQDNQRDPFDMPGAGIYTSFTIEDAVADNMLIAGLSYTNAHQFLHESFWPDMFGENQPMWLEVAFFAGNRARIVLKGYVGEPLFDNEKYQIDDEGIELPWDKAATMLISMRKEMLDSLETQNLPSGKGWSKKFLTGILYKLLAE